MKADNELGAMQKIGSILDALEDGEAVARIAQWVSARYGVSRSDHDPPTPRAAPEKQVPEEPPALTDLADLFDVAGPKTDPERALVVAYWLTESEATSEFTSQAVNSELKHLGYGASNITAAFTRLMKQKPALAMQTAKKGTSRQARKRYKLTRAGCVAVEQMIRGESEPEE